MDEGDNFLSFCSYFVAGLALKCLRLQPLMTVIGSQEQERGKRGKKRCQALFFGEGECYGLLLVNMTAAPGKEKIRTYP